MLHQFDGTSHQFNQKGPSTPQLVVEFILVALVFILVGTLIVTYSPLPSNITNLQIGDVARENIYAPRQIVYESDARTEQLRREAERNVDTIFTAPNRTIAQTQVRLLRQIFDYFDAIRVDTYATLPQKAEWVRAVTTLSMSDLVVDQILIMPDAEWQSVQQETIAILNEALREEIKQNQLFFSRRQLPNKVSLDTPTEQANVIVAIAEDLITVNTFLDEERTERQRQAAIDNIEPVVVQIETGENIILAGEIVDAQVLEKLQSLGLQRSQFNWQTDLVIPVLFLTIVTLILAVYLIQYNPRLFYQRNRLVLLPILLLGFMAIGKVMLSGTVTGGYLYPMAALGIIVVMLVDTQIAFIVCTIMAILVGYISSDQASVLVLYLLLGSWTAILALNRGLRLTALFGAGFYVGLVNVAVIVLIAFSEGGNTIEPSDLGWLMAQGGLNGVLSVSLALIGLLIIGRLLGLTTPMQLIDLGRPTHPLLKQLLLKAPGTYHHSLMVSNLAEQAAERVGANATLVRVMAYYHDIGKMQRPYFFVENQPAGGNVHEKLDPKVSAQIIISHTTDGYQLAKKYGLPSVIQDGIIQHHGTSLVKYFYYQAQKQAEHTDAVVNEDDFRYPGPRPQNKENAILMLADVTESVVRALKPTSAEEIDEIVQKMIADKLETGQLNQCDLTIADLHAIREAFVDMLQGVHHPRIKYPDGKKDAPPAPEPVSKSDVPEEAAQSEQTASTSVSPPSETEIPPPTNLTDQPTKSVTPSRLTDGTGRPTKLVRHE